MEQAHSQASHEVVTQGSWKAKLETSQQSLAASGPACRPKNATALADQPSLRGGALGRITASWLRDSRPGFEASDASQFGPFGQPCNASPPALTYPSGRSPTDAGCVCVRVGGVGNHGARKPTAQTAEVIAQRSWLSSLARGYGGAGGDVQQHRTGG